jgi:Fur family ferric uptake transcriptional regulator
MSGTGHRPEDPELAQWSRQTRRTGRSAAARQAGEPASGAGPVFHRPLEEEAPVTTANHPVRGRSTRQRAAVAAALEEVDEFRSAQDLHDILKHRGDSVGLTTVYRTLQSLADAGEIDVLRTGDGESVYRRCSGGGHHHHLVCRACGKAVEVEGPAVEKWADTIAAEHGFVDVAHTVEIFGTCADCAAPAVAGPGGPGQPRPS